jgi:uncharacterized protein (TIGR03067 family)
MVRFALAVLFASATVAVGWTVAAPVPKALKAKAPNLDGKWQAVEMLSNGDDMLPNNPWAWEIRGDAVTIFNIRGDGSLQPNDPTTKTTFSRPDTAGPDELDYTRDDGTVRRLFRGRVRLTGDELVLCFGEVDGPRVTELKPGKTTYYYRFQRMTEK